MDIDFYLLGNFLKKRDLFFHRYYMFKKIYDQIKLHH